MRKKNDVSNKMYQKGEIAMTEQNDAAMTDVVYEAIRNTIGHCYPESGGMLGSADGGKTIITLIAMHRRAVPLILRIRKP